MASPYDVLASMRQRTRLTASAREEHGGLPHVSSAELQYAQLPSQSSPFNQQTAAKPRVPGSRASYTCGVGESCLGSATGNSSILPAAASAMGHSRGDWAAPQEPLTNAPLLSPSCTGSGAVAHLTAGHHASAGQRGSTGQLGLTAPPSAHRRTAPGCINLVGGSGGVSTPETDRLSPFGSTAVSAGWCVAASGPSHRQPPETAVRDGQPSVSAASQGAAVAPQAGHISAYSRVSGDPAAAALQPRSSWETLSRDRPSPVSQGRVGPVPPGAAAVQQQQLQQQQYCATVQGQHAGRSDWQQQQLAQHTQQHQPANHEFQQQQQQPWGLQQPQLQYPHPSAARLSSCGAAPAAGFASPPNPRLSMLPNQDTQMAAASAAPRQSPASVLQPHPLQPSAPSTGRTTDYGSQAAVDTRQSAQPLQLQQQQHHHPQEQQQHRDFIPQGGAFPQGHAGGRTASPMGASAAPVAACQQPLSMRPAPLPQLLQQHQQQHQQHQQHQHQQHQQVGPQVASAHPGLQMQPGLPEPQLQSGAQMLQMRPGVQATPVQPRSEQGWVQQQQQQMQPPAQMTPTSSGYTSPQHHLQQQPMQQAHHRQQLSQQHAVYQHQQVQFQLQQQQQEQTPQRPQPVPPEAAPVQAWQQAQQRASPAQQAQNLSTTAGAWPARHQEHQQHQQLAFGGDTPAHQALVQQLREQHQQQMAEAAGHHRAGAQQGQAPGQVGGGAWEDPGVQSNGQELLRQLLQCDGQPQALGQRQLAERHEQQQMVAQHQVQAQLQQVQLQQQLLQRQRAQHQARQQVDLQAMQQHHAQQLLQQQQQQQQQAQMLQSQAQWQQQQMQQQMQQQPPPPQQQQQQDHCGPCAVLDGRQAWLSHGAGAGASPLRPAPSLSSNGAQAWVPHQKALPVARAASAKAPSGTSSEEAVASVAAAGATLSAHQAASCLAPGPARTAPPSLLPSAPASASSGASAGAASTGHSPAPQQQQQQPDVGRVWMLQPSPQTLQEQQQSQLRAAAALQATQLTQQPVDLQAGLQPRLSHHGHHQQQQLLQQQQQQQLQLPQQHHTGSAYPGQLEPQLGQQQTWRPAETVRQQQQQQQQRQPELRVQPPSLDYPPQPQQLSGQDSCATPDGAGQEEVEVVTRGIGGASATAAANAPLNTSISTPGPSGCVGAAMRYGEALQRQGQSLQQQQQQPLQQRQQAQGDDRFVPSPCQPQGQMQGQGQRMAPPPPPQQQQACQQQQPQQPQPQRSQPGDMLMRPFSLPLFKPTQMEVPHTSAPEGRRSQQQLLQEQQQQRPGGVSAMQPGYPSEQQQRAAGAAANAAKAAVAAAHGSGILLHPIGAQQQQAGQAQQRPHQHQSHQKQPQPSQPQPSQQQQLRMQPSPQQLLMQPAPPPPQQPPQQAAAPEGRASSFHTYGDPPLLPGAHETSGAASLEQQRPLLAKLQQQQQWQRLEQPPHSSHQQQQQSLATLQGDRRGAPGPVPWPAQATAPSCSAGGEAGMVAGVGKGAVAATGAAGAWQPSLEPVRAEVSAGGTQLLLRQQPQQPWQQQQRQQQLSPGQEQMAPGPQPSSSSVVQHQQPPSPHHQQQQQQHVPSYQLHGAPSTAAASAAYAPAVSDGTGMGQAVGGASGPASHVQQLFADTGGAGAGGGAAGAGPGTTSQMWSAEGFGARGGSAATAPVAAAAGAAAERPHKRPKLELNPGPPLQQQQQQLVLRPTAAASAAWLGAGGAAATGGNPLSDEGRAAVAAAIEAVDRLIAPMNDGLRRVSNGWSTPLVLSPAPGYESSSETGSAAARSVTAAAAAGGGYYSQLKQQELQYRHALLLKQQQQQQQLQLIESQQRRRSHPGSKRSSGGGGGAPYPPPLPPPVSVAAAAAAAASTANQCRQDGSLAAPAAAAASAQQQQQQLHIPRPQARPRKAATSPPEEGCARSRPIDLSKLGQHRLKPPPIIHPVRPGSRLALAAGGLGGAVRPAGGVVPPASLAGAGAGAFLDDAAGDDRALVPYSGGSAAAAAGGGNGRRLAVKDRKVPAELVPVVGKAVGAGAGGVRLKRGGAGGRGGGGDAQAAATGKLLNALREAKALMSRRFVVRRSSIAQQGVFATERIPPNTLLMEYHGEGVRTTVADMREKRYKDAGLGCYLFNPGGLPDEAVVLDATHRGNVMRFVNHSCGPNCVSRTFVIEGQRRIFLFSLHELLPGTELTYDYKLSSALCLDMFKGLPEECIEQAAEQIGLELLMCQCGAKSCRKYL